MKYTQLGAIACLGGLSLGLVFIDPADAKLDRGNGNGNGNHPVEVEDVEDDVGDLLTRDRVDALIDIIYDRNDDYDDLLSDDLRLAIIHDFDALPPGIQQQLARGRGLPPGIAKKYQMPRGVLSFLDLAPDTELLIIGDNIVIVDPADVILDIIAGIFNDELTTLNGTLRSLIPVSGLTTIQHCQIPEAIAQFSGQHF